MSSVKEREPNEVRPAAVTKRRREPGTHVARQRTYVARGGDPKNDDD